MKIIPSPVRRSRVLVKKNQPESGSSKSPALKNAASAQFLQIPQPVSPASTRATSRSSIARSGSNRSSRKPSPRRSLFDFTLLTTWSRPPVNHQGHAQRAIFDSTRMEDLEQGKHLFSISRYLKDTKENLKQDFSFKRGNVPADESTIHVRKEKRKNKRDFGAEQLKKIEVDAENPNLSLSQLQIALAYCKALKGNLPPTSVPRRKELEKQLTARLKFPIPMVDLERIDFEGMKPVSYVSDGFFNGESKRFGTALEEAIVTRRSLQRISAKPKDRSVFFTREPFEAMKVQSDFTQAALSENWEVSRLSPERQLFLYPSKPKGLENLGLEERQKREQLEKEEHNKKIGQFLEHAVPQRIKKLRQIAMPASKDDQEKKIAHLLARLHHERIFTSQLGKQIHVSPSLQKQATDLQQSIQDVMKGLLKQRKKMVDERKDAALLRRFNREFENSPLKAHKQIARRVRQSSVKIVTPTDMSNHVQRLNRKGWLRGWQRWTHEMLRHKMRKAFNPGQVNDLDKAELIGYYGWPGKTKYRLYFDIDTAQEALKQRGWPFKKVYKPAPGVTIAETDSYIPRKLNLNAPYRYYDTPTMILPNDLVVGQTLEPETVDIANEQTQVKGKNSLERWKKGLVGGYQKYGLPFIGHISPEKNSSDTANEDVFRFLQKVSTFAPTLRQHIPEKDAWAFSHLENVAFKVLNERGCEFYPAFDNGGIMDQTKEVVRKAIGVNPNIPVTSTWRPRAIWKDHPQKISWDEEIRLLAEGEDKKLVDRVRKMMRPDEAPF